MAIASWRQMAAAEAALCGGSGVGGGGHGVNDGAYLALIGLASLPLVLIAPSRHSLDQALRTESCDLKMAVMLAKPEGLSLGVLQGASSRVETRQ